MSQVTMDLDLLSEASSKMYETVIVDGQAVEAKSNQAIEFVVDDEKALTDDKTIIRVISRIGKLGDPRVFERLPMDGALQQYVIIPASVVLENGKPYHGDRYTAVAYCERIRKLIFLHDAIDKWGSRQIVSWAVYRSDGPSAHHDLEIKEIAVVPLESKETSVNS